MDQSSIDPELMKQVLALQSNQDDPQAIGLARKQSMVNQMRQSAMTPEEGQMVGRRYVAPSALSQIVRVGQGAMAGHQQGEIDTGMQKLSTQRQAGRGAYVTALTNAMRRPPVAVGQGSNIMATDGNDVGAAY